MFLFDGITAITATGMALSRERIQRKTSRTRTARAASHASCASCGGPEIWRGHALDIAFSANLEGALTKPMRTIRCTPVELPMILTWGRIAIAPLFFLFFELADAQGAPWLAGVWACFLLIEFSDLLDGHFARSRKQESDLGKVLDPFADALSRLTYFVAFAGARNSACLDIAYPHIS